MMNNQHSRAARALAAQFENETAVVVDVSTPDKDSHIFKVMLYLCRYFGKYSIEYPGNGTAIIRKQG